MVDRSITGNGDGASGTTCMNRRVIFPDDERNTTQHERQENEGGGGQVHLTIITIHFRLDLTLSYHDISQYLHDETMRPARINQPTSAYNESHTPTAAQE